MVIILLMAPLLNELFSKIELFYIKIEAINNYFTLMCNYQFEKRLSHKFITELFSILLT